MANSGKVMVSERRENMDCLVRENQGITAILKKAAGQVY
jgi:hypothetical protein